MYIVTLRRKLMEKLENFKPQAATATVRLQTFQEQAQNMAFPTEDTGKALIKYLFMK